MNAKRIARWMVALFLSCGCVVGCLERKETIRIGDDGRVMIDLEYNGKAPSFETFDAMPSEASGWTVERTVEQKGDEEEQTLTAKRSFHPREELPGSYAAKGDPDAELYLSFPTSVTTERRDGKRFVHFHRIYPARPWAFVRYGMDQCIDDHVKELAEKPLEELSDKERLEMLKAFATAEMLRQSEFGQAALRKAHPGLPQDRWLLARQALLRVYEEIDYDDIIALLTEASKEERESRLEAQSEAILRRGYDALCASLRGEGGLDPQAMSAFEEAYRRVKRHYEITEVLGTHSFKIRVQMPGRIVAHNADEVVDEGLACWEFTGDAFRDRTYELAITSQLAGD